MYRTTINISNIRMVCNNNNYYYRSFRVRQRQEMAYIFAPELIYLVSTYVAIICQEN